MAGQSKVGGADLTLVHIINGIENARTELGSDRMYFNVRFEF